MHGREMRRMGGEILKEALMVNQSAMMLSTSPWYLMNVHQMKSETVMWLLPRG